MGIHAGIGRIGQDTMYQLVCCPSPTDGIVIDAPVRQERALLRQIRGDLVKRYGFTAVKD